MNQPQQAVMVNIFMPCELMHAMGLTPMFPEGLSVYVACTACQHVFAERAETSGIPESFCSYHKTMIGMAESGVLPKPLLIAATTLACDANQLSFRHLAAHYPAPLTLIDVPAREDDAAVAYVADQLRELARTLETLTGRKLDEAKLRESMACANRTLALMREYADLRAEVSQDTTMTGELCSLIATHCLLGHADGENYVRELIETAKRAPRRETTRRKRIFFIHTLPNWQDSMIRMLETENRCELVGCDITFDSLMPLDPDKPFESMARRLLANVNGGRSTRRIDNAIAWAKKLNADGVIVFCHWGCKQTMGPLHPRQAQAGRSGSADAGARRRRMRQPQRRRRTDGNARRRVSGTVGGDGRMIGYSCKYAPLELIAAYGGKALMLDAETEDFSRAETLTHANVCCHAKALLTQALDISELVLTDCCDATRRTYDVLESEGRQRFLFQFDLPHDDAACARQRMTHELLRFAKAYGAYTGAAFSKAKFLAACRDNSHALLPNEPFIAVLGARVSPQLLGQIRCAFSIPVKT